MFRYNLTVRIVANVSIGARSPREAQEAIETLLNSVDIAKIKNAEFVIEDSEVTGVFDVDWNELEVP